MADLGGTALPVPPLDRLDDAAVQAVHDASMHIVEDIGIQLPHERAQRLLTAHGARVDDDDVVRIPRTLVEEQVERAPEQFVLHARNPDNDVAVGGDAPPVRAPGYGPTHVRTIDGRRPSELDDYETLLRLAHAEDVITCAGYGLCEPTDLDAASKHYPLVRRALELTDKPIMGPIDGADRAAACMDMVGIAMTERPLDTPAVAGLVNTVPPRRIGSRMLGGLLTYADYGQPLVVSSFTMAGASAPATRPSSLALTNAENLVGITLAQVANPGTPVVYGVPTAPVDGRDGSLSIGSPESAFFAAVAGQLGRYYGLPTRSGGGLTDAKTVGHQSGAESTLLQAVTRFADVDFVLHATGILESYSTISPEKFVLDCEALRSIDRFARGFSVEDADFRLDEVAAIEPGGYFPGDGHGAGTAPPRFYQPDVHDRRAFGAWQQAGGQTPLEAGADRVAELLSQYEQPSLPAAVAADLDTYVERNRPTPS